MQSIGPNSYIMCAEGRKKEKLLIQEHFRPLSDEETDDEDSGGSSDASDEAGCPSAPCPSQCAATSFRLYGCADAVGVVGIGHSL
jgi:hypothetical protein